MPPDRPRDTSAARDESLAGVIADLHGLRPNAITRVEGHGSVNHVFVASSGPERFVIRFARDARRKDEYEIEAWCLAQAAAHGIPSPAVVTRGTAKGVPYLIQTFVPGASGAASGGADRWTWLARYARTLHRVDVTSAPEGLFSRFGRDLPAGWSAHLEYNVEQLTPTDPLIRLGVYPLARQGQFQSAFHRLALTPLNLGLLHGDLLPRNLILQPDAPPVLLDWGTAATGPVPHGELLSLLRTHHATGEPTADDLSRFAEGLDLSLTNDRETLLDLLTLGALDLVRWAIDQRPDLVAEIARASRSLLQSPSPI